MSESRGPYNCCFNFLLTLGLTALFMWLHLRTSNPSCSVRYFYLPGLNKTLNSSGNHTLYFTVMLHNTNKEKGVFYGPVNLTFYDFPNRSHLIGKYTIPGFYQGLGKKARKGGEVETDWKAVSQAVWGNGTAVFRVDLATEVRFKIVLWRTKRSRIMVGSNLVVDETGSFDHRGNKKGIRLKSGGGGGKGSGSLGVVVLLHFLVFVSLHFH